MQVQVADQKREKRERGAEAAREAILDAAEAVFAERGFSGARMDDIARAAGYNKALLFHYFTDKLGLYRALMTRTKSAFYARLSPLLDQLLDEGDGAVTAERIRAFTGDNIGWIFDYFVEHPRVTRILAWEAAEGWRTFSNCSPPTPYSWGERMNELIRRAQAAGVVRDDLDPYILFATTMSIPLIHLASLHRFETIFPGTDFTSREALAHARGQIVELVLRGMLVSA
jgi:TetR/AcrR family transcriptional regulator